MGKNGLRIAAKGKKREKTKKMVFSDETQRPVVKKGPVSKIIDSIRESIKRKRDLEPGGAYTE